MTHIRGKKSNKTHLHTIYTWIIEFIERKIDIKHEYEVIPYLVIVRAYLTKIFLLCEAILTHCQLILYFFFLAAEFINHVVVVVAPFYVFYTLHRKSHTINNERKDV